MLAQILLQRRAPDQLNTGCYPISIAVIYFPLNELNNNRIEKLEGNTEASPNTGSAIVISAWAGETVHEDATIQLNFAGRVKSKDSLEFVNPDNLGAIRSFHTAYRLRIAEKSVNSIKVIATYPSESDTVRLYVEAERP